MSDELAHAVTLRLLAAIAEFLTGERREVVLDHRDRVERLLRIDDDESVREMVRDALSL